MVTGTGLSSGAVHIDARWGHFGADQWGRRPPHRRRPRRRPGPVAGPAQARAVRRRRAPGRRPPPDPADKDTSRGGKYHNKREFVALAGELGLAWPQGQRPHSVIGFGEIRGTEPLFDLGHFLLHDQEHTPIPLLDDLLAGYGEVVPLLDGHEELVRRRRCCLVCASSPGGWDRSGTCGPTIPPPLVEQPDSGSSSAAGSPDFRSTFAPSDVRPRGMGRYGQVRQVTAKPAAGYLCTSPAMFGARRGSQRTRKEPPLRPVKSPALPTQVRILSLPHSP